MQKRYWLVLVIPLIMIVAASTLSASSGKEPNSGKGYAGINSCQGCHQGAYDSYIKSVHAKKKIGGPADSADCESCHGPGSKHVEKGGGRGVSIFDFDRRVDANERSEKCLSCHEETRHLTFWSMGRHRSSGVACNDCHSVHSTGEMNLKEQEPELCFGCHKSIRAKTNKQSHHPIREGKIRCTSCHNPHGSFDNKMIIADTVNELCYGCHAEKRGPFLFEHVPGVESCLNCHDVHGSNHNFMLVRKPPQLCQSCHDTSAVSHTMPVFSSRDAFTGADSNSNKRRFLARNCMTCHTNIHGSNGRESRRR